MLLKAAMPFNFSSPEYLSPHKRRKNRVSPVSRASPAHMNSPLINQTAVHIASKHLIYSCIHALVCGCHFKKKRKLHCELL